MRGDLHVHSNASDGTVAPGALMERAAAAGLDAVALTDHDTVSGWAEAAASVPAGLTLLPGIEVSARWHGASPGIGLHLLAYLPDPEHPPLAAALRQVRADRAGRARRMVQLLRDGGIDVTWDEVAADASGASIGRPHLAQALIRRGLVGSVSEAFGAQWLGGRFRLPKRDLEVFEALRLVRAAGGVPVFAHPLAHRRGRVVPDHVIAEMADAGLAGLEADHPDHGPADRAKARRLAAAHGLFVTGSSDYHGSNKTTPIGAETTGLESYRRIVSMGSGTGPVPGG